ncbi:MAG: UbiA prenyltransferase family protein [Phycisphaeraceae bacterium]|nr:UbiA prenyltransferase family protein [Phycisphaeraceae bacterium]
MTEPDPAVALARPTWRHFVRLARPHQWAKGVFVAIGPAYGFAFGEDVSLAIVVLAIVAFGFASSGCYVVNDIKDREADRHHPRKRRRPIASGVISVRQALWFALALFASCVGVCLSVSLLASPTRAFWLGTCLALYVTNVLAYSLWLKHVVIVDVICLALGFVLRVLGGCAAAGVEPSTWLLNCTFFLSMFLAFGKRLGERRTMGDAEASRAREVQGDYTEALLRMVVVMTAVATLITYAGYVEDRAPEFDIGFNVLWLTMLPATFALLRCIVLVEQGRYDDPTELAVRDLPFQIAAALFGLLTVWIVL